MKKQKVDRYNVTMIRSWMRDIDWFKNGKKVPLRGQYLILYARIWTLTQGASYYGIRAADLGAWAGLRKIQATALLNEMEDGGLIYKRPSNEPQGCEYNVMLPSVRTNGTDNLDIEGWMISDLGLTNANEILTYAIVYKYRHAEHGYFGKPGTIAKYWAGCTERTIQTVFAALKKRALIHVSTIYDGDDKWTVRKPNREVTRRYVHEDDPILDAVDQARRDGHEAVEIAWADARAARLGRRLAPNE